MHRNCLWQLYKYSSHLWWASVPLRLGFLSCRGRRVGCNVARASSGSPILWDEEILVSSSTGLASPSQGSWVGVSLLGLLDSLHLRGRRDSCLMREEHICIFLCLQQVLLRTGHSNVPPRCSPEDRVHRFGTPSSRFKWVSTEEGALQMVKC